LKKASEIGLDKRGFYRLKKKVEINKKVILRKKIWKRPHNFI